MTGLATTGAARRPRTPSFFRGYSEFGEHMARMMASTPGAVGAVLSDGRGEPIDFAHDPARIDALEIQIVGAQIGQTATRLRTTAVIFGLGEPATLLTARGGHLITASLEEEYLLTVLLARSANIARAMAAFSELRATVAQLL